MRITFKGLGTKLTVDCDNAQTCEDAIATFERLTGKVLKGMAFYSNGKKIEDLSSEAPEEIFFTKEKHESNAKITFKGLGTKLTVDCEDGQTCEDAIATFERLTGKVLKGMAFYSNGKKIEDLSSEVPGEIFFTKEKHESNAKITFKGLGTKLEVDCEDGETCEDAIATFERLSGKILKGMAFYSNGKKIEDLSSEVPGEIFFTKEKHESN